MTLSLHKIYARYTTMMHHRYTFMPVRLGGVFCGNGAREMFGSGSTGLWVQLFILSKFPELLDTFFIVVHKKPLIFLHWYHHMTFPL